MEMKLAENIRALRKARSLTQEQLSEVLGVTAGAVYKWEAKLSVPELDMIMEMADFFDTSVDVLLGYEMKDNRMDATVKRLQESRRNKDRAGMAEAEKALKKYPYSFRIVNESASVYRAFGIEDKNKEHLRRALELTERSRLLLSQNEDPQISEETLYGRIATTYLGLDETDRALEIWKAHNAGGMYNHVIGHFLASDERTEEAVPFLSEALAKIVGELCDTVTGYMTVFFLRGDHTEAAAILQLALGFFAGLKNGDKPNFLDKVSSAMLAALAFAQFMSEQTEAARTTLQKARDTAEYFDAAPSYDESDIRFIDRIEGASAHDDIGATAADAVENVVHGFENEAFTALWETVANRKEDTCNE